MLETFYFSFFILHFSFYYPLFAVADEDSLRSRCHRTSTEVIDVLAAVGIDGTDGGSDAGGAVIVVVSDIE